MKNIRLATVHINIIQLLFCFCITIFLVLPSPVGAAMIYPPEIKTFSAVMIDADSGLILYQKNKNEILYPASVTKIMTALLAVEHYTDYEQLIKFSNRAIFSLPDDGSNIAMNEGETLTVDNAMYGLMLASANEVANALSEDISGSIEDFAARMSIRAWELGAYNSKFTNPHGLHDDNHYSTAYDMALIMREAVKHPEFLKYISTQSHNIPPTELQPLPRPLNNSNKMIIPSSEFYNEDVVGGKTGFTDEAMHTLVTYASRDGINLIVSIFYSDKNEPYIETKALLDYGFAIYPDRIAESLSSGAEETRVEYNPPRPISKMTEYVINEANYDIPPQTEDLEESDQSAPSLQPDIQADSLAEEYSDEELNIYPDEETDELPSDRPEQTSLIPAIIVLIAVVVFVVLAIIKRLRKRRRFKYRRLNSYGSYSKYGRLKLK